MRRVATCFLVAFGGCTWGDIAVRAPCAEEVVPSDWGVVGPGGVTADQLVAAVDGATLDVGTPFGSQTWSVSATPAGTPSIATREADSPNCSAGVVWQAPVQLQLTADDGSWVVEGTMLLEGNGAELDAVSAYYAEQDLVVTTAPEPVSGDDVELAKEACPDLGVGIRATLDRQPFTFSEGRIQIDVGEGECAAPRPSYSFDFTAVSATP